MKAHIKHITLPRGKRVICVSDVHGCLDLFKSLLDKIAFSDDDILILLGDLYTKGKQKHETLKYIIELSLRVNVYVLRGNCDWIEEYLTNEERTWLDNLPHVIESRDYIFVHGGLTPAYPDEPEAMVYMKNDCFMEQGLSFDKYVITGHWPTGNYTHGIPCCNPIVNEEQRIIAIDGGIVLKNAGQINAFIIHNGAFSFDFLDALPLYTVEKAQRASGGELNITWNDRFVELVEAGVEFGQYRHVQTGKTMLLPGNGVWKDNDGNLCECDNGTDYFLPVEAGDIVSVFERYSDRILAKKSGVIGWIML